MIQLILFLAAGAGLFAVLAFLVTFRQVRTQGSGGVICEARQALSDLQSDLLPSLAARIFSRDDLVFITAAGTAEVRSLFLAERKSLALAWIAKVRECTLQLRRFHYARSRFHADLKFGEEMKIAAQFALVLAACRALALWIYVRGAFGTPGLMRMFAGTVGRVCRASEKGLAFLDAAAAVSLRQSQETNEPVGV